MARPIIIFKNVGEKFDLYHYRSWSLKDSLANLLMAREKSREEFWALRDINFEVDKGETVGIIGENGSGKTTILNLIARILMPDEGEVFIRGRVSALLELGVGFHPDLTGRENVCLYGTILGLTKKTIDSKLDEIIRFAELEKFIDAPIKTYSAGMYVRLGFATAINVDPDILLIDEALAVGDLAYQKKCIKVIEKFKAEGKTIIFVSHNMFLVNQICQRVILLRKGRIISDSLGNDGINIYMQTREERKKKRLRIAFEQGKIKLFYKNRELTKNLGFYTSIRSLGMWHDSTQAEWELRKVGETKISASVKWQRLPIRQIWEIEILNNSEIVWEVEMEVSDNIQIEREQTNIMLIDSYRRWFIRDGRQGDFPKEFNEDYGGDWQSLWKGSPKSNFIAVSSVAGEDYYLPSLTLDCPSQGDEYIVNIVNSDRFFEGRVLQCLRENSGAKKEFQPCKYNYFSGRIKITDLDDRQ